MKTTKHYWEKLYTDLSEKKRQTMFMDRKVKTVRGHLFPNWFMDSTHSQSRTSRLFLKKLTGQF